MTQLIVSLGGKGDFAAIERTWRGDFATLVDRLLKKVNVTDDKASAGWICGAHFNPEYRHSEHFVARHLLSLDYDHITPEDLSRILKSLEGTAFLAYTTWSHHPDRPRLRVWIPLSRGVTAVEFQAVSRKVAARCGIELAARESHTPAQFMFRPAAQKDIPFEHWEDVTSSYLDADKVLGEYDDWKDRSTWPRRAAGDSCHEPGTGESPLDKPGIVGEFCRAFRIADAITRFGLPYRPGSTEGRWTYTAGSRADGAVSYDDDTKLHSYHDTDPAHGQHNVYDLVRLHMFGNLDGFDGEDVPIADRPSSRAMERFANEQPELRAAQFEALGFTDMGPEPVEEQPAVAGVAADQPREGVAERVEGGASEVLPQRITSGATEASDLGNARRIQARYGKDIIAVGKAFYVWSGTHWVQDDAPVKRRISELSKIVYAEVNSITDEQKHKAMRKWAETCCSAANMASCENLLKSFLDVKGEALNADRFLLSCRSGTLDLRTGQLRPHSPRDFITACAPTKYDPAAQAPRFALFLRQIFKGDESLCAFAQRWFGYCITGEVKEHAMVFHIGEGGNGKGKLMEALQYVLGPGYAGVGARSLLGGHGKGASPELADLMGRRMVTLTETNRDEEFNEGILKELTGGDRLKARNLYQGYFEFNPTHKLQIFTNNEPRITGQDRGIWRRLFLLNYTVKYGREHEKAAGEVDEIQDDELDKKLAAEAEGILAWLVQGAVDWYQHGLQPPPAVVRATLEYKARQDNVGTFLAERTIKDINGRVPLSSGAGSLYVAYKGWAAETGNGQLGRRNFVAALRKSAPYANPADWVEGGKHYRGFTGLRLTEEALL